MGSMVRKAGIALLWAIAVSPAADLSLQVSGVTGRDGAPKPAATFDKHALAGLPRTRATIQDHTYEGVLLCEILKRAGQPLGEQLGGKLLARFILVSAHDGYRVIFSLPEIDPVFGNDGAFVADTMDGKPLEGKQAPFTMVVPGEKRHTRWIYGMEKIEVVSAPEPVR